MPLKTMQGEFGGEGGGGVHPLERPELPLEIKAALFAQLLAEEEGKGKKVRGDVLFVIVRFCHHTACSMTCDV